MIISPKFFMSFFVLFAVDNKLITQAGMKSYSS